MLGSYGAIYPVSSSLQSQPVHARNFEFEGVFKSHKFVSKAAARQSQSQSQHLKPVNLTLTAVIYHIPDIPFNLRGQTRQPRTQICQPRYHEDNKDIDHTYALFTVTLTPGQMSFAHSMQTLARTRARDTALREKTTTGSQDTALREQTTTRSQNASNRLNDELQRREAEKRQRVEQDVGLFGGSGPLRGRPMDDDELVDYMLSLSEKRRRIGRGTLERDRDSLLMESDEENMDPRDDESTSPTDLWKGSRLRLTAIKDMTKVTSGPQVFGSSSSLIRRESRSSSSDTRLGRVNFRLRDLSGPRQKAQWKRLIHAVTLDYIQHGPESGDLEDDQRDIMKII